MYSCSAYKSMILLFHAFPRSGRDMLEEALDPYIHDSQAGITESLPRVDVVASIHYILIIWCPYLAALPHSHLVNSLMHAGLVSALFIITRSLNLL